MSSCLWLLISTAERIQRPPHRRDVAMVFQDLALWPNLTTRDNVRLGLAGLRLDREQSASRIQETLAKSLPCRAMATGGRPPWDRLPACQNRVGHDRLEAYPTHREAARAFA
jgi:ABC-type arginine transport system ATPase subunit